MKPYRKPKYKIDPFKLKVETKEDLTEEELYQERLREKNKLRRR